MIRNKVILRGFFQPADVSRRLFVEGQRNDRVLTGFLPIVEPAPCGRTGPYEAASVPLRILHDGRPKNGVRLIGRVYRGQAWKRESAIPVEGTMVFARSPDGNLSTITDAEGIYDIHGSSAGTYVVSLEATDGMPLGRQARGLNLDLGEANGIDFYVQ